MPDERPQAVVFDLDGTLLDTERLARACFVRACAELGWQVDLAVYDRCVGATWEATERIMRTGYGADFPYAEMEQRWSALYHAHVDHKPVNLKPGIALLLERLEQLRVPMAVATSSRRATVETKLALAGIERHFAHLVCGGETRRGKPHADPYLLAVAGFDLPPAACWALEDSDNGVRAAHAAGMLVFQIPDEMQPSESVSAMGHQILDSAAELIPRLR